MLHAETPGEFRYPIPYSRFPDGAMIPKFAIWSVGHRKQDKLVYDESHTSNCNFGFGRKLLLTDALFTAIGGDSVIRLPAHFGG